MSELVGGCLCGAVRYVISKPLTDARSCHCSRCRKAFSGAGSAYAKVEAGSFSWVRGADLLVRHSTGKNYGLAFCGRCGSTLVGLYCDAVHGVALGSVDGDPGVQIEQHLFVGSRAPWDHIGGDAPQFDERPPE